MCLIKNKVFIIPKRTSHTNGQWSLQNLRKEQEKKSIRRKELSQKREYRKLIHLFYVLAKIQSLKKSFELKKLISCF